MLKQYFILGRNPELSRFEIISYLDARYLKFKEIFFEQNFLLLELSSEVNINELGGTIKSAVIESEGSIEELENYLLGNELIEENKFTYAVFGNLEPDLLKLKFKTEKRKAVLKHGRRRLKFQNNEKLELPDSDYSFILHQYNKTVYFGKINQEYDSKEIEFRDMNKPTRREHLAISPRLSKILINLSGAKQNELLLDPFCGIGGILIEALLKEINIYGLDSDPKAIYEARKNINWLKQNYKIKNHSTLECKDSKKAIDKNFDAVATETPLGEVLRKKPGDSLAKNIISKFEAFIIPILKHLKQIKKQDAKIAITFPKIRNFSVNLNKIHEETKLIVQNKPILESRKKQFINREIVVFM